MYNTDNSHYAFLSDQRCKNQIFEWGLHLQTQTQVSCDIKAAKSKFWGAIPDSGKHRDRRSARVTSTHQLVLRPTRILKFDLIEE